jgi:GDP-mannose 6-dehydrogenase
MKITVFGMGYVGCVTASCLAEHGHEVTGVDVVEDKVEMVNRGLSPIIEPGLSEMVFREVHSGRLRATCKADSLGEVALVCVGTPSNENGSLGLGQMLKVVGEIGALLATGSSYVVVAIRSTVLPGTVEQKLVPLLEEKSGRSCGVDFGICMNPEFMRETTAVHDFGDPPFTVIGVREKRAAARLREVYAKVAAPVEETTISEAEMIKYACNAFHATKVCFANEIGNLGKRLGIDSHRVLEILCRDRKLNLSPYYLKPGFAFGGSCLPKDLRAILHCARQLDVDVPMLNSLLESNHKQLELAFNLVRRAGKTNVGVLGLSFKAGTDDLRESPVVSLIETLIGKGYKVKVYDQEVSLAKLNGANRRYIEQTIPHISSLMTSSVEDVLNDSEVVVVSKKSPEFAEPLKKIANNGHMVIDLVRLIPNAITGAANYEGICW